MEWFYDVLFSCIVAESINISWNGYIMFLFLVL